MMADEFLMPIVFFPANFVAAITGGGGLMLAIQFSGIESN